MRMGSIIKSLLQSLMKMGNAIIGMSGIALVIYSLWMIRVWNNQTAPSAFPHSDYPFPWFIYTFLGLGVTFCVIFCSGHIAAETLNGCCLYLIVMPVIIVCLKMNKYMMLVFILLVLEGVITTDVFLNHNWEQDFPKDDSGNLHELKVFIGENFDFCKWIGLAILTAQGLSFILAMVLKALGPHRDRYYDSDEEYASTRHPLLRNSGDSSHVIDPLYVPKK